jgi:hypothetical protein
MYLQVTFNGGDYNDNAFIFTLFSINKAVPRSGPADGTGGDILIQGLGFSNATTPLCNLDGVIYNATSVTWDEIRCPMPKSNYGDTWFGNVPFSVSPNTKDWHTFEGGFQYYPSPTVNYIDPQKGPNEGMGIINFYGADFRNDFSLINYGCKIGESYGSVEYVSSDKLKCVVYNMELTPEGELLPA